MGLLLAFWTAEPVTQSRHYHFSDFGSRRSPPPVRNIWYWSRADPRHKNRRGVC